VCGGDGVCVGVCVGLSTGLVGSLTLCLTKCLHLLNRDSAVDDVRAVQMEFRHRRNYDMVEIRMSEKNSDGVWNEPDYYVIHVSIVNCVRIKRFLTIGSITMMTTTYADNAGTHTTTCTRW
jgi:hypothetical protein